MNDLFNTTLTLGHHTLTVLELMEALLVFLVARIFLAVVRRGLRRAQRFSSMDEGKQFSLSAGSCPRWFGPWLPWWRCRCWAWI